MLLKVAGARSAEQPGMREITKGKKAGTSTQACLQEEF